MKTRRTRTLAIALLCAAVMVVACTALAPDTGNNTNGTVDNTNQNSAGNDNGMAGRDPACAEDDASATLQIAGVFDYDGMGMNASTGRTFELAGTITFEQQGDQVRVSDTTYIGAGLRRVAGEFVTLEGNRFMTQLTPISGEGGYAADVVFVFSNDGNSFCVEFMDSNTDQGELGSFKGTRVVE